MERTDFDPVLASTVFALKAHANGFTDISPRANALTVVGSATSQSSVVKFGPYAYGGGSGPHSVRTSPVHTIPAGTPFSLSSWVYLNTIPSLYCAVLQIGRDAANRATIWIAPGGAPWGWWEIAGVRHDLVSGRSNLSANTWYHLRLTYSAGSFRFYVNGVSQGSSPVGVVPILASCVVSTGNEPFANASDNGPLNGYLQDPVVVIGTDIDGAYAVPTQPFGPNPIAIETSSHGLLQGTPVPARVTMSAGATSAKARDLQYGGTYQLVGTVTEFGAPAKPVARRVRLIRERDGLPVRETWSDAAGHYAFTYIAPDVYTVVAYDHTHNYRAVIADNLLATPMGAGL